MSESEPLSDEQAELVGSTVAGRYRIERLLGVGGMGAVYEAEHVMMKKSVALKVLHKQMTLVKEVVARFEREAIAASRVEHPHVAAATDFGQLDDGAYYLALELVSGQSLEALMTRGALESDRALHIAHQIASALEAAHANGVVHRDLKPENIMLSDQHEGDFVKVLDFGIAKLTSADAEGHEKLTQLGTVFGTPAYMSPEQAMGAPADERSDLYTTGVILYEMLCGHEPFRGEGLVAVLTAQMTKAPEPLPDTIPAPIRELVMQLLAKDAANRVQTATELLQRLTELRTWLAGGVAPPVPTPSPVMAAVPTSQVTPSPAMAEVPSAPIASEDPPDMVPSPPGSHETQLDAPQLGAARTMLAIEDEPRPSLPPLRPLPAFANLPKWWPLAAAGAGAAVLALLVVVIAVVALRGRSTSLPPDAPVAATSAVNSGVAQLRAAAESGEADAIDKLAGSASSGADWIAIARGRAAQNRSKKALSAYRKAAEAGARFEERDAKVLRKAADSKATEAEALEVMMLIKGPQGVDLLLDVWTKTRRSAKRRKVHKQALAALKRPDIRKRASPAAAIAIDLAFARTCGEHQKLLERAEKDGDARSARKLTALTARKGCGFLRMGDCFSCLRRGSALSDALKAAKARSGPKF